MPRQDGEDEARYHVRLRRNAKDVAWRRMGPRQRVLYNERRLEACAAHARKTQERKNRKPKRQQRQEYINQKKNVPCMDCQRRCPPYAMDFDYVIPSLKPWSLSQMLHRSPTEIDAEIAKCDVICAVCHRIRTHDRHERRKAREREEKREMKARMANRKKEVPSG